MLPSQVHSGFDPVRTFIIGILLVLPLLVGCGTSSYREAVDKSKPELALRSKFASLGLEYVKFPDFPVSFRVPNVFVTSDEKNQNWKVYGKALKIGSKDPLNPDTVVPYFKDFIVPPEFFDAQLNPGHQGTFLTEYKVTIEDAQNQGTKQTLHQHLMMSIWIFDTAGRIKPPNEASMLLQVKARGREPDALNRINAALKKAERPMFKPGAWEEDTIPMAPGAGAGGSIQAKRAGFFVKSIFLSATDDQNTRRPVEKDGVVRLWSFKLENRYQVFLMLRVPLEMTGETGYYQIDAESPDADKLVEIGRAVIGSMVVDKAAAAEGEAKKK